MGTYVTTCRTLTALVLLMVHAMLATQGYAAEDSFKFSSAGDHFEEPPAGLIENIIKTKPDFVLSSGDILYKSSLRDFKYLKKNVITPFKDNGIDFYPCLGNHEFPIEPNWKKIWGDRGDRYYSFDHKNAHFIVLDSNKAAAPDIHKYKEGSEKFYIYHQGAALDAESEQFQWLKKDLESTKKPYIFVSIHNPPFSYGGHHGLKILQKLLSPLFQKHKVTAVFSGDSHGYERFKPLFVDPKSGNVSIDEKNGVNYIVSASGTKRGNLYDITENKFHATFKKAANFVTIEVKKDTVTCTTYQPPNLTVIDTFTIQKRR